MVRWSMNTLSVSSLSPELSSSSLSASITEKYARIVLSSLSHPSLSFLGLLQYHESLVGTASRNCLICRSPVLTARAARAFDMSLSLACSGSIAAIPRSFSVLAPLYAPVIRTRARYWIRSVLYKRVLVRPLGPFHTSAPYVIIDLIMPVYSDLAARSEMPGCELPNLHIVSITVLALFVRLLIWVFHVPMPLISIPKCFAFWRIPNLTDEALCSSRERGASFAESYSVFFTNLTICLWYARVPEVMTMAEMSST